MADKDVGPLVDMKGALPVGHFMALTAAVRHLHEELEHWEDLPAWLCLRTPHDASALKGYLAAVCASLEPTAKKLAVEHPAGPADPPKLQLVKGAHDETEG